ncbi:MAG: class I SAM-dependent methyltransferase [Pseudomonadota bacterium]
MFRSVRRSREPFAADYLRSLVSYSNVRRAALIRDHAGVESALQRFWEGASGDRYHSRHRRARYRHFLEHHAELCEVLRASVRADPGRYQRLVELGCGDGHVLCYAAGRLPELKGFIGIDLNARAIDEASRAIDANSLRFLKDNAFTWLSRHAEPGTVALTAGGMLEYACQETVVEFLQTLSQAHPSALAIIEPLDPAHDIEGDPDSRLFGRHTSFSHAYPALVSAAGFRITWSRETEEGGIRWLLLLAESRA